jgi:small subunit ribosomal protein S24e
MEIDILNKKENKVLDRTEVKFDCIYSDEATPKILDVKSKLVALLNTQKDLIVVDSIQPHYGQAKASGYAKIYGSKDSLEDIETEHVITKNKEAETEIVEDEDSETSASE